MNFVKHASATTLLSFALASIVCLGVALALTLLWPLVVPVAVAVVLSGVLITYLASSNDKNVGTFLIKDFATNLLQEHPDENYQQALDRLMELTNSKEFSQQVKLFRQQLQNVNEHVGSVDSDAELSKQTQTLLNFMFNFIEQDLIEDKKTDFIEIKKQYLEKLMHNKEISTNLLDNILLKNSTAKQLKDDSKSNKTASSSYSPSANYMREAFYNGINLYLRQHQINTKDVNINASRTTIEEDKPESALESQPQEITKPSINITPRNTPRKDNQAILADLGNMLGVKASDNSIDATPNKIATFKDTHVYLEDLDTDPDEIDFDRIRYKNKTYETQILEKLANPDINHEDAIDLLVTNYAASILKEQSEYCSFIEDKAEKVTTLEVLYNQIALFREELQSHKSKSTTGRWPVELSTQFAAVLTTIFGVIKEDLSEKEQEEFTQYEKQYLKQLKVDADIADNFSAIEKAIANISEKTEVIGESEIQEETKELPKRDQANEKNFIISRKQQQDNFVKKWNFVSLPSYNQQDQQNIISANKYLHKRDYYKIIKMIRKKQILSKYKIQNDENLFFFFAHSDSYDNKKKAAIKTAIDILVAKNFGINAQNSDGDTPLMVAIKTSNSYVTEILLDNKADITIKNHNGEDALSLAKMHNDTQIQTKLEQVMTNRI
jgi:hypothetical protein